MRWTRWDRPSGRPKAPGDRRRSKCRWLPRAEALEDRTLLGVVTSSADDGGAGTLRNVIAATPAGQLVIFAPNVDNKPIFLDPTKGPLVINKNLTIEGPGLGPGVITIDGQQKTRVFMISANAAVSLIDLTVTHGDATTGGGGGGIYSEGILTVTTCAVTNNTYAAAPGQSAAGGGIANFGGTLEIVNSTISGNSAVGGVLQQLGAPDLFNAGGGGVASVSGDLSISSASLILNNRAVGGLGFVSPMGVPGPGGNAWGGGVYESEGALTISSSTIATNTAVAGPGVNTFGGPGGEGDGGGIYDNGKNAPKTPMIVSVCLISANQAVGGMGGSGVPGAAGVAGGTGGVGGIGRGGGIWCDAGDTVAGPVPSTVTNTVILGNASQGGEGGLGGTGGGPKANGGPGGAGGDAVGGGLYNEGLNLQQALTITLTAVTSNRSSGGNGGSGGNPGPGGAMGRFGDGGGSFGGGIGVNNGKVTVTADVLVNNFAVGGVGDVGGNAEGGGMLVFAGTTTLSYSVLSSNVALGGPGSTAPGNGIGGGLFIANAATVTGASTTVVVLNQASTKDNNVSGNFGP